MKAIIVISDRDKNDVVESVCLHALDVMGKTLGLAIDGDPFHGGGPVFEWDQVVVSGSRHICFEIT